MNKLLTSYKHDKIIGMYDSLKCALRFRWESEDKLFE